MNCTNCIETKIVPTCASELVIGVVSATTNYTVYVKNNATNYCSKQDAASNADGYISIDLTTPYPDFYSENFYYTIWVTEVDDNVENYVPVTISEQVVECFLVRFKNIYTDDAISDFDIYSLELC